MNKLDIDLIDWKRKENEITPIRKLVDERLF